MSANKQELARFKILSTNNSFTDNIYSIYMYKHYLALNNFRGLISYKTQPTNPYSSKLLYFTIFTNLSVQAGYDIRPILKQSLTRLN